MGVEMECKMSENNKKLNELINSYCQNFTKSKESDKINKIAVKFQSKVENIEEKDEKIQKLIQDFFNLFQINQKLHFLNNKGIIDLKILENKDRRSFKYINEMEKINIYDFKVLEGELIR